MILVVGATGVLGQEICRLLRNEGRAVRALVREKSDPAVRGSLEQMGVETVTGDLKDRSALQAACRGVQAVISTASTMSRWIQGKLPAEDSLALVDRDGHLQLIDAAREQGVSHFIFISVSGTFQVENPLIEAKRDVERALRESGLKFTILRPTMFMESWLHAATGFDYQNGRVRIYGDGQQKISWIALGDVARFAVAALDQPAARNAVLELGGPQALTPLEVVHIFEEASGRTYQVEWVPREALESQHASSQDPYQRSLSALALGYAAGDPIDMTQTLQVFGIPMTAVTDYCRRTLGKS